MYNISNLIKCQKCKGNLDKINSSLVCNSCNLTFPILQGILFLGYNSKDKAVIEDIIAEEKESQVNLDKINKDIKYAGHSFKLGISVINYLRNLVPPKSVALNIGSGGAPFHQLLQEAGFNTFSCEIEPNSLYTNFLYDDLKEDKVERLCCDINILPFQDESVELVFSKELVHHIESYESLFHEVNRVLKKDGLFVIIEPTLKYKLFKTNLDLNCEKRLGHHLQKINDYLIAFKKKGFTVENYFLHFNKSKRLKFLNILKKYFNDQLFNKSKLSFMGLMLKKFIIQTYGGENIVVAKKNNKLKKDIGVDELLVINPAFLTIDENYIRDERLKIFKEILSEQKNNYRVF